MNNKIKHVFKLIFPSLLGILLFLIPVRYHGESDIVVGIIGNWVKYVTSSVLVPILIIITVCSATLALWHKIKPIPYICKRETVNDLFSTNVFWLVVRVIGAVITLLVYFRIGSKIIWEADTGGNMLSNLLPTCAIWYLLGGVLLPLLTDYGLSDLFSAFFKRTARLLFHLPGRAMIDCVSAWIGSNVCGIYQIISQYETGRYTAKESAIIISNFCIVSISFCSLIASMLGLGEMFGKFYLTLIIAGMICAVITPRLWPLCRFPETYNADSGKQVNEDTPAGMSDLRWGYLQALKRSSTAPNFKEFWIKGLTNTAGLMLSTLPVIMAFGTVALIIANYTPVFDYLGIPLGMYLRLFQVPDAMSAGAAITVGFADQFIPVFIGSTVTPVYTRFIIGCISILQVVYATDVGALILTSRVPLRLWHIVVIFVERVIICIPIVVLCAHLFGIA